MADYTITLTTLQENILKNDLLDIQVWIQDRVDGKINKCKSRLVNKERADLITENAITTPTALDTLAQDALDRPGYKDRATREAESTS